MISNATRRFTTLVRPNLRAHTPISIPRGVSRRFNSTKPSTASSASSGSSKQGSGSLNGILYFTAGVAAAGVAFNFLPKAESKSDKFASTTHLSELDEPQYGGPAEFAKAKEEIVSLLGPENVTSKQDELDAHSDTYWNTHHAKPGERPNIVVYPKSTEEVSEIMKISHKYRIPIIPFAGGTSLEGHFTPTYHGISIDFTRMSSVIALHKEDLDIVVQPGLGWEELDDILEEQDLFFGPDPGPGAQISGMIGTGCSGTNAYRYGTMRENVLAMTVVLADGTILKTRQRPRKSSAGYNLTQFFIGSEGTLGVVTEATLKLHPRPKNEAIAMVTFDNVHDAAKAASAVVQEGHQVGAIELLDDVMMYAVNKAGQTARKWPETPTVAFKFSGTKDLVKDQVANVRRISKENHNNSFHFADTPEQRAELWAARKAALWSTIDAVPKGHDVWTTDVAVPMSRLAEIVTVTKEDIVASGLFGTIVGHVGDGNFHAILMYDPKTERDVVEGVVHRMVKRALEMEGTCTGEHGVGVGKKEYLPTELGPEAVQLMRKLKVSVDPLRLLNPDKVVTVNPNAEE